MATRATSTEMIRRLVAFDTTSRNSNLELMDFVRDYLDEFGIASRLIPNDEGTKANLYATLGPADAPGGVILSGHTDVVPVDGQAWDTEPFEIAEKDGALFGRGTSDMKSFIAVCLAMVPDFLEARLKTPVHFAFSYDEEVGCIGVASMIEHVAALEAKPAVAIVGEPTRMSVVDAHKGIRSFRTRITGREAHSSATHVGLNAVAVAARLIGFLSDIADELRERGDPSGRFDPPYTSLSIGPIQGGTALNIIPRDCQFSWEYRCLPSQDEDEAIVRFNEFVESEVLPEMKAVAPDDAGIVTTQSAYVPLLTPETGSAAEVLALRLASRNETEAVSYGTEAGHFQNIGIPTVVCGPGDIAQAHRPNEFIELAEVAACERFMRRLIEELAA